MSNDYGLFALAIIGMVAIVVFSHELVHWYQFKDLPGNQLCFFGKHFAYLDNYYGLPLGSGWKIEVVPTLLTMVMSFGLAFYLGTAWKNRKRK